MSLIMITNLSPRTNLMSLMSPNPSHSKKNYAKLLSVMKYWMKKMNSMMIRSKNYYYCFCQNCFIQTEKKKNEKRNEKHEISFHAICLNYF